MLETCISYSLCESFDFSKLSEFCIDNFNANVYREVISVNFQNQEFHIFEFGIVIFWGEMGYNPEVFFTQIRNFCFGEKDEIYSDYFNASVEEKNSISFKFSKDHLKLPNNDPLLRLAISFPMAQSMKLADMEDFVTNELSSHSSIPQDLANRGDLKLTRKKMAKIRGRIFTTESQIHLKYDLLDKPEFLWHHPEYDEYYNMSYEYLEIAQRITVLNKKLLVLRDILNILADELQFKHSTKLEWIIIILIAIEIVMSLIEHAIEFFK